MTLVVFLVSLVAVAVHFGRDAGIFKTLPFLVIAISALLIPSRAAAQIATPDQVTTTDQTSPATPPSNDAPETTAPETTAPETAAQPATSPEAPYDRPVSWKLLYRNVLEDQKQIWSFPARLVQGQNWTPTAAVLGTTAGLVLFDPTEAGYFRRTTTFNGFDHIFNGNATAVGMGAVPASLYVIGLIRKDSKMQHTALLAGEAMFDGEILTNVLKSATMRIKPAHFPVSGNLADSWFDNKGSPYSYIRGNGSFPSGHSIAAFSVATVVARRYSNHRWVPYAAYGLASLVGFSRLTLNMHFLSDVFMGGALGYSISRYTVLRQ